MLVRSWKNRTESKSLSRRSFVGAVGAAGAVALAGCTGDSPADDTGEGGTGGLSVGSHAFDGEGTVETPEGTMSMTISGYVTDGGDSYTELTTSVMGYQMVFESYIVGTTMYTVSEMGCSQTEVPEDGLDEEGFVPDPEVFADYLEDFEHQGQSEIDGVTVDIYEVDYSDVDFEAGAGTGLLYIDMDAMQLRRMEYDVDTPDGSGSFTMDLHSYGESFTVEPPAC